MTYEGSSTPRIKLIEVNAGYSNNPDNPFSVVVVDPDIQSDSIVVATQSGVAASDKDIDENELDHFLVNASPSSNGGSMTLILYPMNGVTLTGKYMINYMIGAANG